MQMLTCQMSPLTANLAMQSIGTWKPWQRRRPAWPIVNQRKHCWHLFTLTCSQTLINIQRNMQTLTCKMSPFRSMSNIWRFMLTCISLHCNTTSEVTMLETLVTESDLGNMLLLHWVCASDQSVHIRQLLGHYTNHLLPLVYFSIQKRGREIMQAE